MCFLPIGQKEKNNWWQNGPFTLYWPHLNKPPLSLPVSHILFKPSWVKALSLPPFNRMPVHSSWGFHVSPNTERRGLKKGPPERNPICVLIHSAGLDMSKQHAFTTLATLFTSHGQTIGVYAHTLTKSKFLTANPTPSQGLRDKHFDSHTQNKTSWLFVTREAKLPETIQKGGSPVFLNSEEIYGPQRSENCCV